MGCLHLAISIPGCKFKDRLRALVRCSYFYLTVDALCPQLTGIKHIFRAVELLQTGRQLAKTSWGLPARAMQPDVHCSPICTAHILPPSVPTTFARVSPARNTQHGCSVGAHDDLQIIMFLLHVTMVGTPDPIMYLTPCHFRAFSKVAQKWEVCNSTSKLHLLWIFN